MFLRARRNAPTPLPREEVAEGVGSLSNVPRAVSASEGSKHLEEIKGRGDRRGSTREETKENTRGVGLGLV